MGMLGAILDSARATVSLAVVAGLLSSATKPQMKTSVNDLTESYQERDLFFGLALACLLILPGGVPVNAQQITGTPGSPSATTTINGTYLPPQPPQFGGVINLSATQSKPWWPPRV